MADPTKDFGANAVTSEGRDNSSSETMSIDPGGDGVVSGVAPKGGELMEQNAYNKSQVEGGQAEKDDAAAEGE